MSEISVQELAIYPVKSLGQVLQQQLSVGPMGPEGDRRFMLVDRQGLFITQRSCSQMTRIQVSQSKQGFVLTDSESGESLSLPDGEMLGQPSTLVEVWGDRVQAALAKEAGAWLSEILSIDCRLVYIPEQRARVLGEEYTPVPSRVGFADRYPLLLTTVKSLADFNQQLGRDITMQRFRPNVVVTGAQAWAEDEWQRIRIGEVEFTVAAPCARCVIPSIDPQTGEKQPDVSRTLAKIRRRDGQIYFGQNLVQESEGLIRVGDKVEVLE